MQWVVRALPFLLATWKGSQQASLRTPACSLIGVGKESFKQVPGHSVVVRKEGREERRRGTWLTLLKKKKKHILR